MHDKIIQALKELEKEKQCRILFAAESGSRAWGFASPDSDYDIRAIYVKPESWYWDIAEKTRDTIEAQLPGDLDISAWELRKTLRLFDKCNPSLNEWLGSPIIYLADEVFFARLKGLVPEFFNPIRAGHHYLSLAENAWHTIDGDGKIALKKLFYALRGVFCAMWSAEFKTMPPTEFDRLLIPELLPDEISLLIRQLKVRKQQAGEKAVIPLPTAIRDFYHIKMEQIRQRLAVLEYRHPDNAALTELLRHFVKKYS